MPTTTIIIVLLSALFITAFHFQPRAGSGPARVLAVVLVVSLGLVVFGKI
jgi:hypothetical protein